ncbi:MAG: tRNA pseudouridine13 synthase [Planctomycetota bacterium]|jgi:tRNA pseudouridine13 synthase
MKPMRPVPRGCAAGLFHGLYKVTPEDFVVEELPAYEPSGDGSHVWMWIEKRGLSTIDMLRDMGDRLGRHQKSFGIAGLKDAKSVSRQWVSMDLGDERECDDLESDYYRVLSVSRHHNKLRLGQLRGNRFHIVLRGTKEGDLEIAQQNLAELERVGVPNYFGEQRFGKRGANLAKGLEILSGDVMSAARRMPRRVFGLVLSAVQSEVFNRIIAARLDRIGTVLRGDLAMVHSNGATFTVEDPEQEQARVDVMEVSPTGPMPGPEMMVPSGEPLEIELKVLSELGLSGEEFNDLPFGLASGERKPLRMPIHESAARMVENGLEVSFNLPKGGYATSVLRELLRDTIWFGRDRR